MWKDIVYHVGHLNCPRHPLLLQERPSYHSFIPQTDLPSILTDPQRRTT